MAVLQAQQFRAVLFPAAGLLPQLGRLHRRHQQFQRTGAIHFLAYDAFHLAQYTQPERQPGVYAGRQLADHAGAQHELMADHLGVGGGFLQGGKGKA